MSELKQSLTLAQSAVQDLRAYFDSGITRSYRFRVDALKNLRRSLKNHESDLFEAYRLDYNKCEYDVFLSEMMVIYAEIDEAVTKLKFWMKPEITWSGIMTQPSIGMKVREPYGVALVVAPWNYPLLLSFGPIIGSIEGGNCTVFKPSANAPRVATAMQTICEEAFSEDYVRVINASRDETADLFDQNYDICFFTGGTVTGKKLLAAQAAHVTPVILELGGKSPVIIAKDADIPSCVRKLAWGKFLNAGQTCVAPDYVLVEREIHDEFVRQLTDFISKKYYKNGALKEDFTHIISDRQYADVISKIDEEKIIFGGGRDPETRLLEPTVLDGVALEDKCMQRELFAPILPILTVDSIDDAIQTVNEVGHIYNGEDGAKPLALYCFTSSKKTADKVIRETSSGGACINEVVLHCVVSRLPFGGVGYSGNGAGYHGKASFETFTHRKSVVYDLAPGVLQRVLLPFRYSNTTLDKLTPKLLKANIDRLIRFIV